jgi:hypothetical protein
VAPDGSIWIAASVLFLFPGDDSRAKGLSGEDIWQSRDGGRTFKWIADPADLTGTDAMPGPGGGDTDIATATALNPDGTYNVYAVTGWAGSVTLSISRDSGKTWITTPLGAPPAADRPWVVADGRCVFYVTNKPMSTYGFEEVTRYDLCNPATTAVTTTLVSPATAASGSAVHLHWLAGRPAVDTSKTSRFRHSIYVPVRGCAPTDDQRGCSTTGTKSTDVHISRDGGRTFTAVHVGDGPSAALGGFPMVATDAAGTVYVTWGGSGRIMFAVSRDGGATWKSRAINTAGFVVAFLPQVAANQPGEVALAWYGSRDSTDVKVFVARSRDGGRSFAVGEASPVVFVGVPCLTVDDVSCDGESLRDNFGIVINPRTDKVTVTYTSDRPQGERVADFVGYATEG